MRDPAHRTAAPERCAANLVRSINAHGGILLVDPARQCLCLLRGHNVPRVLRMSLVEHLQDVVAFLETEAEQGGGR